MRTEVQERLAQSLHNAVWLTLGMEQQDYRVERPFSATVVQPSQSMASLAAGTRIIEVFNRAELNRQLLILGEPGAGKTTMMLELAEDLLRRAIADKTEPIPVLLSLSSWKNPQQSIFDWLLGELKEKYGIRQDLAGQWLEKNQLLPLLDGLDEVAPQHQQACAVKLNEWLIAELEQRPCGVLICCRREEFEQVVQQPLSLYGAIYVQPLTVRQIEDYFTEFDLQNVWQTVQQDKALQEILTKPLFLSMFGLVQIQGKFSLWDWQLRSTSEDKIEYLLDTYWEAAMTRELIINPHEKQQGICSKTYGSEALPTRKAVRRSLVFLAKSLSRELSTEFLIEKIQPSWLSRKQHLLYFLSLFGLAETIGLFSGLIGWKLQISNNGLSPSLNPLIGLIAGLIVGLFFGTSDIEPIEVLQFSWRKIITIKTIFVFIEGLIGGLIFGLILGLILGLIGGLIGGLILGLILGLIGGLVGGVIESLKAEIETRTEPNAGILASARNFALLIVLTLPTSILFSIVHRYFINVRVLSIYTFFFGFTVSLIVAGFSGGAACIQHLVLRVILSNNKLAPWNYARFLNYCTERLLLQRVGGRYRFMHKLLQDHFARMDLG
ncbi:MAG: NACHT domain-containing protein [Symploca sp. SIO1B1]|nr:NACHT domain-containing protein [Symploca sp. SIO1B1]